MDDLIRTLFEIAAVASGLTCRGCLKRPAMAGSRYCAPCDDEVREMVDEHDRAA